MLQRIVLAIGALLTVSMLLYPPWLHVSGSYSSGAADFPGRHSHSYGEFHAGYHLLFRPPYDKSRVNVQLLLLQIGSAALVTWFIYAALNRRSTVQDQHATERIVGRGWRDRVP
jgi:hypothetical protein